MIKFQPEHQCRRQEPHGPWPGLGGQWIRSLMKHASDLGDDGGGDAAEPEDAAEAD